MKTHKELIGKIFQHPHTEIHQNKAAVYADVYLEDENGNVWFYSSACFKFELHECKENDLYPLVNKGE